MSDMQSLMSRKMTVPQKILNTAIILVVIVVVVALVGVFHIGAWVPFLVLVLWAIQGIKMNPASIAQEFLGVAMGLFMGYLVQHSSELGAWALPCFFVLVGFLFVVMINQIKPLDWLFNNYTAAFCTVGTALSYPITIVNDYLFALALFGILPMVAYLIMSRKKKAVAAQ